VLIRFLLESKLRSWISSSSSFFVAVEMPFFSARVIKAHSVGSPITHRVGCFLSGARIAALLHKDQIDKKNSNPFESDGVGENDHSGAYHVPNTSMVLRLNRTDCTVISLVVRVPVLSVQIALTAHNVSTAESFFTNAFFFARYDAAEAKAILTCAGSH